MHIRNLKLALTAGVSAAALSLPALAMAQAAPAPTDQVGEVVVTAGKRPELLQDVASAVTALAGPTLQERGVTSLADIEKTLTGVQIYNNANAGTIAIRGVSQSLSIDNASPAVGFNLNGVLIPRQSSITSFFDIEQIEVLPGPQGTLYGGSSAGGVMNVTTRRPGWTYGGEGLLELGAYDRFHGMAALNVPVSKTLSFRIAGDYDRRDGYLANGNYDNDALAGRISGLYRPNDQFYLLLVGNYYENKGLGVPSVVRPGFTRGLSAAQQRAYNAEVGADPFKSQFSTNGFSNIKINSDVSLEMGYDFGKFTLTNVGGFSYFKTHIYNQSGPALRDLGVKGQAYSNELRIANKDGGRSKWVAGLFYYQNNADQPQINILLPNLFPPAGRALPTIYHTNKKGYAAFGQETYSVTPQFRLTLGGRYSWDNVDGGGATVLPPAPLTPANTFGASVTHATVDFKVGAEYDVTPEAMVYAAVQTGYLPGGYNTVASNSPIAIARTFDPQRLVSYSAGAKTRFLDRRLTLNGEFFYYNYEDFQQQEIETSTGRPITFTYNAPKARIYGIQFDARFLLTSRDEFDLGATVLSARFTDFNIPGAGDFSDFWMPYAASTSATAGYRHTFDLGSVGSLAAGVRTRYNSGYWGTYNHQFGTKQGAYFTSDATLTYQSPDQRWTVTGYVNNIEDNAIYLGMQALAIPPIYAVSSVVGPPRTYGVRVGAKF